MIIISAYYRVLRMDLLMETHRIRAIKRDISSRAVLVLEFEDHIDQMPVHP
jgi:hypothetical protein